MLAVACANVYGGCIAMAGAESKQPVGALFYQWVGCRDHSGLVCFPHSGSWQVQGGPAYICRDQRKCVFHNMGPLRPAQIFLFILTMDH